ncbi:MAG: hypothetical protein J6W06_03820 [Bacteroidales bacterium]|nr:hypothetical protein [Bacteroidales bacterium]
MRNILLFLALISMVGMGCNCSGNTSEPANDEAETENVEANVEQENEESATEPETYSHYSDYQITLPADKWEVTIAYSNSGIRKIGEKLEFDVKHWDSPSLEDAISKYSAESRHDDIVVGDYTWKVFTDDNDYFKMSCYIYNSEKKYVVRVATDNITDPNNPDLRTVLEAVRFVD